MLSGIVILQGAVALLLYALLWVFAWGYVFRRRAPEPGDWLIALALGILLLGVCGFDAYHALTWFVGWHLLSSTSIFVGHIIEVWRDLPPRTADRHLRSLLGPTPRAIPDVLARIAAWTLIRPSLSAYGAWTAPSPPEKP